MCTPPPLRRCHPAPGPVIEHCTRLEPGHAEALSDIYLRFNSHELDKDALRTQLIQLIGPKVFREALALYAVSQLPEDAAVEEDPDRMRQALDAASRQRRASVG